MVVNPNNGEVRIWWNYGPDDDWANGWRFVSGGVIATGVPHANWDTLRFPDINGDGRGDYVTIGVGGSLALWLNSTSPSRPSPPPRLRPLTITSETPVLDVTILCMRRCP